MDRCARTWLVAAGAGTALVLLLVMIVVIVPMGAEASRAHGRGTWCSPQNLAAPVAPSGDSRCDDAGPQAESATPTLRSLARSRGIRVGSAASISALDDDARYAEVLRREFSSITPEDAMKWRNVEPVRGTYNWSQADRLVEFAQRNRQQVYGHALVWHSSLPDWLSQDTLTTAEAETLLGRHITDEVTRYKGKIWAWDVVNEPLDADGNLRNSVWLRTLGPDYVAKALRWARAADPVARLFINDYGIEGINAKSDALYRLVRKLRASGVPIDGVGFQTHWNTDPLPADFAKNLRRFADLGIEVAITEADVRIVRPASAESLAAQAAVYRQAAEACLSVPRCVSFTVWGFSDKYSWVPSAQPGTGEACLFSVDYRAKPAYDAVAEAFRRGPVRTSTQPSTRRAG